MNRPLPVDGNLLEKFCLEAIGREMRGEEAYQRTSKNARTLVRGDELTTVVVALKQGTKLKEHHSSGPATVIVLEGEIDFHCPGQDRTFRLTGSQSVVFSSAIQHSVRAIEDSLLLIVFGQKER